MNLISGKLYWHETLKNPPTYSPLDEDITCDVLIVGSGSSGAHCAYFLSKTGMNTVLVDKRKIGYGSTSANTGMLQYMNDKSLTSIINTFGEEKGVQHYYLCVDALKILREDIIPETGNKSDHINRKSLYFASTEDEIPFLRKEYQTLIKYNFPVEYYTNEQLKKEFSFSKPAALVTSNDAEINPYKHVHALLSYASKKGVRIFEETKINGKKFDEEYAYLYTSEGKCIKAKHVIVSTGYEAQEEISESNAQLLTSYSIVTNQLEHITSWKDKMLIWETERPYIYLRTTIDNRIIIGGLDEVTTDVEKRESMLLHKRDRLVNELVKLFPELSSKVKAEYSWCGIFGETHDGLPMLGQYENYPHCYFLLGYGGNGTVYSIILSNILKDILTKGSSPDLDLYLSNRPILYK